MTTNTDINELINRVGKGDMVVNYPSSKTFNGYDFSIMKSAMQKYIRRNIIEKAIYCAVEMDLFSIEDQNQTARSHRTNMINRLIIITCEDISLANPLLPLAISKLVDKWESHRTSGDGKEFLLKIVMMLSSSKKIRYLSFMKSAYGKNPKWVKEFYPQLYEDEKNIGQPTYSFFAGDFQQQLDGLAFCVEHGRRYAFVYLFFFLNSTKKLEKRVLNHYHPIYIVWKWIIDFHSRIMGSDVLSKLIGVLLGWYNTYKFKEKWLFVGHALACLIDRNILNFYDNEVPRVNVYDSYTPNIERKKIEIDDYCIDKHTLEGKKNGKTNVDFVLEGSYVKNEDKILIGIDYRDVYISLGVLWDDRRKIFDYKPPPLDIILRAHKLTEDQMFGNILRAQLLCSKSRPDVYLAKMLDCSLLFEIGDNVVVKGPYIESLDNIRYIMNIKRKFYGINSIKYEILDLIPISAKKFGNPTNFGSRTKIEDNKTYKFLVMENVCRPNKYYTIIKESKLWKPTNVADMEKMGCFSGSIDIVPDDLFVQLLTALIFRYIYSIPDTSERNLVYSKKTKKSIVLMKKIMEMKKTNVHFTVNHSQKINVKNLKMLSIIIGTKFIRFY